MLASGGQIAAERAEGCGAGHAAQASGDLLSDLDRADVLLRGVIREWHPEVHREPQDVRTQRTEPVEQVHRDRPLAAPAALRFGVGGAPSGDQRTPTAPSTSASPTRPGRSCSPSPTTD